MRSLSLDSRESKATSESTSNLATINDLSADLGENSTTLSSIQSNPHTPEKGLPSKAQGSFFAFQNSKESEFKELLDNLEIENIQIVLDGQQTQIEEEKKFSVDIDKLLSDEEDLSLQQNGKSRDKESDDLNDLNQRKNSEDIQSI